MYVGLQNEVVYFLLRYYLFRVLLTDMYLTSVCPRVELYIGNIGLKN